LLPTSYIQKYINIKKQSILKLLEKIYEVSNVNIVIVSNVNIVIVSNVNIVIVSNVNIVINTSKTLFITKCLVDRSVDIVGNLKRTVESQNRSNDK